jgi:hypothetical protein
MVPLYVNLERASLDKPGQTSLGSRGEDLLYEVEVEVKVKAVAVPGPTEPTLLGSSPDLLVVRR